jgi:hypothetical protein
MHGYGLQDHEFSREEDHDNFHSGQIQASFRSELEDLCNGHLEENQRSLPFPQNLEQVHE